MLESQQHSIAGTQASYPGEANDTTHAGHAEFRVRGGTAPARKRFDMVYERQLVSVLDRSQADSCVALVDLSSGEHLQRAKAQRPLDPLNGAQLLLLSRGLWRPQDLTVAEVAGLRQFTAAAGGINGVTLPLERADLFLSRLPASSKVLVLLVRHRDSALNQDTMPRARMIQAKVAQQDGGGPAELDLAHRGHSDSIWQKLFQTVLTAFRGANDAERGGKVTSGILGKAINDDELVVFAELIDLAQDKVLQQYRGNHAEFEVPDAVRPLFALRRFFDGEPDIAGLVAACGFPERDYGKALLHLGDRDFFWLRVPSFPALHIPFAPNCALLLYKKSRANPSLDWIALDKAGLDLLRLRIGAALVGGLKTKMFPFPETHIEFQAIVDELGRLPHEDLLGRLDVGGFAAHPVKIDSITQRCQECIYYLPHRKWCDLPELPVPVEANWWCRLWKI